MKFVDHTASSSLDLPPGSYIYRIVPIDDKVAAISSDDTLRIADPTILRQIPNGIVENVNGGVTCLESHPNNNFQLSTAGRDGLVKTWDLRTRRSAVEYRDGTQSNFHVDQSVPFEGEAQQHDSRQRSRLRLPVLWQQRACRWHRVDQFSSMRDRLVTIHLDISNDNIEY